MIQEQLKWELNVNYLMGDAQNQTKKVEANKELKNQLILSNLLVFMDRVEVKGRNEVNAYNGCINWLESTLAKEKGNLVK